MSTIFSHAVNAIKTTSDTRVTKPTSTLTKKEIYSREEESKDPKSILNRIQLNKKVGKPVKSITLRKNSEDDDRSFGIDNIQRKIIKKEPITLKRPSKKSDMEGAWKHDLYDGPTVPNPSNMHCTVFVRNLPEGINSQYLRDILQDDEFVVGIRLDNGTAEVNFSKKDAAQRAADELNGKMLKGRKIKAAVMGEINTGVAGKTSRQSSRVDETKEDNDRSFTKTKMHADDQDDRKPSILSRIKKTH